MSLLFEPLASSSAGCCYRLSGGGASAPLLIEAGIRVGEIQKAIGFTLTGLAGCLVTHDHGDHASAMVDVMRAGVDVFASRETHTHARNAAAMRNLHFPEHRAHELRAEEEAMVGDWLVLPFASVHDTPGALGFVIGSPSGHRLLFLTDTAYSRHTFEGLTHVAAEANWSEAIARANAECGRIDASRYRRTVSTHLSLERLLELFAANDMTRVEEIHLLHLSAENSDEAGFKRRVERATGIPTFVCAERSTGVLS